MTVTVKPWLVKLVNCTHSCHLKREDSTWFCQDTAFVQGGGWPHSKRRRGGTQSMVKNPILPLSCGPSFFPAS